MNPRTGPSLDLSPSCDGCIGRIDELQLGIVPVLLGAGLRLFDQLDRQIELERVRMSEEASITYLHFRVIK